MNTLTGLIQKLSTRARARRARQFREAFSLTADTTVLDLGSQSGAHIHSVLAGTPVRPENTYIADIDTAALERGAKQYGFQPVLVGENGRLPFPDGYFDIVYCSSVIEHVTLPKNEIWSTRSGKVFRERSLTHQRAFARSGLASSSSCRRRIGGSCSRRIAGCRSWAGCRARWLCPS
jgi:SAM-dependent methyltransferase